MQVLPPGDVKSEVQTTDVEGKLRGQVNGGGPLLSLRTGAGDIRLRSR